MKYDELRQARLERDAEYNMLLSWYNENDLDRYGERFEHMLASCVRYRKAERKYNRLLNKARKAENWTL